MTVQYQECQQLGDPAMCRYRKGVKQNLILVLDYINKTYTYIIFLFCNSLFLFLFPYCYAA